MEDIFSKLDRRTLDTPRGPVVYWVSHGSSDKTLVFLHGLLGDHSVFAAQAEAYLGRYNMLIWDSPAHGLSRPCSVHTYGYAAWDLHEILTREGLCRPILIGNCLGGAIAQMYLRYHSAEGFIALDTLPYGSGFYSKSQQRWLWQIQWACVCFLRNALIRRICRTCCSTPRRQLQLKTILGDFTNQELHRIITLGTTGFLKENRDQDIPCPALLVVGQQDRVRNLLLHNRQWAEKAGLPLHEIPDAGHLPCLDQPEAVTREIQEFLNNL